MRQGFEFEGWFQAHHSENLYWAIIEIKFEEIVRMR
jgi:hypothetical protein